MFESKIENGTLKGNKVSLLINMDIGTLTYDGVLAGDEMKFHVKGPDGSPMELNARSRNRRFRTLPAASHNRAGFHEFGS
jgi:hypothetical protein